MIIKIVCEYYRITPEALFAKNRDRSLAEKRHMVRKLLRSNYTLHQIGMMTHTDHSNVVFSIRRAEALIATDKQFSRDYDNLRSMIEDTRYTLQRLCKDWGMRTKKLKELGDKFAAPYAEMLDRMVNIHEWAEKFGILNYSEDIAREDVLKRTIAKTLEYGVKVVDIREFITFELNKLEK